MKKNMVVIIGLLVLCMVVGCQGPEEVTGIVIKLNGETVTSASLQMLKSIELTAVVQPDNAADKAVQWSSSDEKVATVSNTGRVDALYIGETTITVTAGVHSAACKVTVRPNPLFVTSVAIQRNDNDIPGKRLAMDTAEKVTLSAVVFPYIGPEDRTVEWESSDTTKATIVKKDGVTAEVTALKVGPVKITAKTKGKTLDGESATDQLDIIIIDNPVREISMQSKSWIYDINNIPATAKQLVWTVRPDSGSDKAANDKVTWKSSDNAIATVDQDGKVTPLSKKGTATITAAATDGSGVTGAVEIVVYDPADYYYSWTATGSSDYTFADNGASNKIKEKDWTLVAVDYSSSTENPKIDASGLYMPRGTRLVIGTTDTTATTATSSPDGQFDLNESITLIIDYYAFTNCSYNGDPLPDDADVAGAVFEVYINNNTKDPANSPLGVGDGGCEGYIGNQIFKPGNFTFHRTSRIEVVFTPHNFTDPESLKKAFIGLRADEKTSIVIHGIRITRIPL